VRGVEKNPPDLLLLESSCLVSTVTRCVAGGEPTPPPARSTGPAPADFGALAKDTGLEVRAVIEPARQRSALASPSAGDAPAEPADRLLGRVRAFAAGGGAVRCLTILALKRG
jgi:hypothetical protein